MAHTWLTGSARAVALSPTQGRGALLECCWGPLPASRARGGSYMTARPSVALGGNGSGTLRLSPQDSVLHLEVIMHLLVEASFKYTPVNIRDVLSGY